MSKHLFSTFDVTRQVFHTTKLSLAIVNLKPLLPGHVLVLPRRVVPRLTDLEGDEVNDLFGAVQAVGRAVEGAYKAEGLTISIQDGASAGQSVPHVHVHILPRFKTDFGGKNDDIYPALESSELALAGDLHGQPPSESQEEESKTDKTVGRDWGVPKDEERKPRGMEEMQKEAEWLGSFF